MSVPQWTVLEKLLLAQAVYKHGEDSWFQIARNLRQHPMLNRQPEYFNQKNCSLQYYLMIEDLEAENRRHNNNNHNGVAGQDMPPVVKLARQLYMQRVDELKRAIKADEEKFLTIITEIDEIRTGKWDARLAELLKKNQESELRPEVTSNEAATRDTTEPITESGSVPVPDAIPESGQQASEDQTPSLNTTPPTAPSPSSSSPPPPPPPQSPQQPQPSLSHTVTAEQASTDSASVQNTGENDHTVPEALLPVAAIENRMDNEKSTTTASVEEQKTPVEEAFGPVESESEMGAGVQPAETVQRPPSPTKDLPSETPTVPSPSPAPESPAASSSPPPELSQPSPSPSHSPAAPLTVEPMGDVKKRRLDETDDSTALKRSRTDNESVEPVVSPDKEPRPSDTETDLSHPAKVTQTSSELEQPTAASEARSSEEPEDMDNADTTVTQPHTPSTDIGDRGGADAEGTESVTGSESNAPTPTSIERRRNKDENRQQKSWQKNINLLWREIVNHKNGAMYMNPIKEATAPMYYDVVKHPMDLKTIKNRIRDGVIKSTVEFERDVVLMLTNSLMYNKEGTEIYQMALEMLEDVREQMRVFKNADSNTSTSSHTRKASIVPKGEGLNRQHERTVTKK